MCTFSASHPCGAGAPDDGIQTRAASPPQRPVRAQRHRRQRPPGWARGVRGSSAAGTPAPGTARGVPAETETAHAGAGSGSRSPAQPGGGCGAAMAVSVPARRWRRGKCVPCVLRGGGAVCWLRLLGASFFSKTAGFHCWISLLNWDITLQFTPPPPNVLKARFCWNENSYNNKLQPVKKAPSKSGCAVVVFNSALMCFDVYFRSWFPILHLFHTKNSIHHSSIVVGTPEWEQDQTCFISCKRRHHFLEIILPNTNVRYFITMWFWYVALACLTCQRPVPVLSPAPATSSIPYFVCSCYIVTEVMPIQPAQLAKVTLFSYNYLVAEDKRLCRPLHIGQDWSNNTAGS